MVDRFKHLNISDWLIVLLISLAVTAVGFHFYETTRDIPYLEITSPIIVDKEVYRPGDTIVAEKIEGIRFKDSDPRITRTLRCDNQRLSLRTIQPDELITDAGEINFTNVNILALTPEFIATPTKDSFTPGTNCFIDYESCDPYNLPLGGFRLLCARYFTDTFDIKE